MRLIRVKISLMHVRKSTLFLLVASILFGCTAPSSNARVVRAEILDKDTFAITVEGLQDVKVVSPEGQKTACEQKRSNTKGTTYYCPLVLMPWHAPLIEAESPDGVITFTTSLNDFMSGVVVEPYLQDRQIEDIVPLATELGVKCVKFWLPWNASEPRFSGGITQDWNAADSVIQNFTNAGLCAVPLIIDATTAPGVCRGSICGRAAPEDENFRETLCNESGCTTYLGVGEDAYIDAASRYAFALASRYRERVFLFNVENELNWACTHTTVAQWRVGRAWCDEEFIVRLLSSVSDAIHRAHPGAAVSMNFNVHDPDLMYHVNIYHSAFDLIGLGAYPNYLFPEPVLGNAMGEWITIAGRATGKPVMVLETGYPSGPTTEGYSEDLQAEYVRQSFLSAYQAGSVGYIYLKLRDPELPFTGIKRVENFWGLVDAQGTPKKAYYVLKDLIQKLH